MMLLHHVAHYSNLHLLQVCRKGWMIAVGGTEKMHRTVRSCVLRGLGPGDAAAEVSMKKMLRSVEAILDASGKRDNEKRAYAAHWWKSYLLVCDWLRFAGLLVDARVYK